jgi:hypothetical protein
MTLQQIACEVPYMKKISFFFFISACSFLYVFCLLSQPESGRQTRRPVGQMETYWRGPKMRRLRDFFTYVETTKFRNELSNLYWV